MMYEMRAVERHDVAQAAQLVQIAGVCPVVDDADQEEHAGRGDAVGQHHEHRAVDPVGVVARIELAVPSAAKIAMTAIPRVT